MHEARNFVRELVVRDKPILASTCGSCHKPVGYSADVGVLQIIERAHRCMCLHDPPVRPEGGTGIGAAA
jgi:hypothetical protein